VLTGYAHNTLGIRRLRAEIEPGNDASIAVAESIGYRLSDEAPVQVEDGCRSFTLFTWVHEI
jgi:RimJ/RimL family protein N-acetyltransferase